MNQTTDVKSEVKEYYGKILKSSQDLQSSCCTAAPLPPQHAAILNEIDDEILDRFYGCGSPIPELLEGLTLVDLGCGTGRDCYLLSKLVGPTGRVIGVDMTEEQLDVARRHIPSMTKQFGYEQPNVDFRQGYIEDLQNLGLADNSVDLVVSNCVINLSPDKESVFREIYRILKPGGELCFSDVYADRRIPADLKNDPVFYGECLGGALYREDFRRLLSNVGWPDFRYTKHQRIGLNGPDIERKAGTIQFYSATVRAFKLELLEDRCEDYGQAVVYRGTIPHHEHAFDLDLHHHIEAGRVFPVCGNTAAMLGRTRFAPHFEIIGNRDQHYGLFDCGDDPNSDDNETTSCC